MTSADDKENKDEIDKDKSENDVEEKSEPTLSELEVLQKKYDENYGMKIGLVLNRLFCRDISWTIYEYL